MSKLKVTTIANVADSESTDVTNVINGSAKAWVNFDGTFGTSPFTVANGGIRAAFNVSSVTDNGTGNYTVNFTNAFADTNFAYNITGRSATGSNGAQPWAFSINAPTTSSVHCYFQNMGTGGSTYTATNPIDVSVAIFR